MNKLLLLFSLLLSISALTAIDIQTYSSADTTHIFILIPFEQFFFAADQGAANYLLSLNLKDANKKPVFQEVIEINLSQNAVIKGAAYLHEFQIPFKPGKYKLISQLRNIDLGDKKETVNDIVVSDSGQEITNILVADNGKFQFFPSAYSQLSSQLKSCYLVMDTSTTYDSIRIKYQIDSINYQEKIPVSRENRFNVLKLLQMGTLSNLEVYYYSGNIVDNLSWSLFKTQNNYSQVFTLKEQLQQIRYIANQNEWKFLSKVDDDLADAIERFWEKHNKNPGSRKNEVREMFNERVIKADELFTIHKKLRGWKSDRGRIYIQYGPPDDIVEDYYHVQRYLDTRTYPHIQWYYYKAHRVFNFVDKTGYGNYQIMDEYYED